jgi:uncharacterized membrane protein YwzB
MSGFIIFLAYALIFLVLLGVLWWCLQQVNLPQPIKTAIVVILVCVAVIYFVQSGEIPTLTHRG